ncbi:MAG: type 2 isopentenyl-diphosphate Delta-isomerase [Bdellovibrionaceae bacterium]|nr:type 2 isopentenyl-diphosphate Delta-isomerase [Pseudobdellovibrionaceae bacterium]MDW8190714.1 type 2 isopentenyl-diphosphate Delta-isomerase [Pseudobdellovibrionaceae bacterium]
MKESARQFRERKRSHIAVALSPETQVNGKARALLDEIELIHEALPDVNLDQISMERTFFGYRAQVPLYISSMTAGHSKGVTINRRLARAAQEFGWMMGVGSQRRELNDPAASKEWKIVRKVAPKACLLGNIGITQLIDTPVETIEQLIDHLEARALFVHLNPLQEALQPEGTPYFSGAIQALERLVKRLSVPVIVKEVGCGISVQTVRRLVEVGVQIIDVAGLGGTHWGRVEGLRAATNKRGYRYRFDVSLAFWNWGISTVESLLQIKRENVSCQVWASGGVRTGVDAAKLIALGAQAVGIAQPLLQAALKGEQALFELMKTISEQLRIALFVTGCSHINDLNERKVKYGILRVNEFC